MEPRRSGIRGRHLKTRIARRWALGIVLGCAAFGAQAQVVVSQIYGGGGDSGATLRSDFIELHNNGDISVNLSGWSVQYTSGTGSAWQVTPLSGSIAPGGYYLVKQANGAGGTADLPAPDAVGTVVMAAGAGKVALVGNTTAFTTTCTGATVDFVPYGFGTNCAFPTASPSATRAVRRSDGGCDDSFNSGADFEAIPPEPRNRTSPPFVCSVSSRPPEITITDVGGNEGSSGRTLFAFTANLSRPAREGGVRFMFATAGATATQRVDFEEQIGQIEIPFAATSARIFVSVIGDTAPEPDETFTVKIDPATVRGATLADGTGVGTILDDDTPIPDISISDTSVVEGVGGTTELLFTASLSAAFVRPVTVDYATADGTATAGIDYVSEGGTLTIPAGSTSVTFGVTVNGDTVVEPDETFFVDLSNPTEANIADAQGVGTIVNDDVPIVPIHDIQSIGNTSPKVGQPVTTRGIVTGRRSDGFFLQTADADADADQATSQGIFVFTSAALPADALIGNALIVSGTVTEFVPAADPDQLSLTQITDPSVTLVSIGNALPTPVQLTPSFPIPDGPLDQLERVEGMRVTAASFTVVAATGGNYNEAAGVATGNGELYLVVTGRARPFRTAGIQAPDPAPSGGSIPPIPRWDFNPELLFSDTDALGGPAYNVSVGSTLTNYVGPLGYGSRRYSVHQDPNVTPTITHGPAASPARAATADEFTYATYNLDRFFDDQNDPAIEEPVLQAHVFQRRLGKASLGIRDFLGTPDVVGVVEVENLSTLQALAVRINSDAVAASQPNPSYVAYLQEGNDVGGIDVGYLVKSAPVSGSTPRVEVVQVVQLGKTETWNDPRSGPGTLLNDRPPLLLDAVVHFANGQAFPVTLIQVHQRSLKGATTDDADGARVRAKRQRQADYLATQIDLLQDTDPARRIAVGGGFNAFEFNDGLVHAMGVIIGRPSPDNTTAVPGDGVDLLDRDLINLLVGDPADPRYSFEFDGNVQSLDHILINQVLHVEAGAVDLDDPRINVDFPEIARSDANTATRLSDHDPVVAYFSLPGADLAIFPPTFSSVAAPGSQMSFFLPLRNLGSQDSFYLGVGFAFDAELPDLFVAASDNSWSCDSPTVETGTTFVACSGLSFFRGHRVLFLLDATVPLAEAGNTITMAASADARTFDPQPANNSVSAEVAVTGGGLALTINGPATIPASQATIDYAFQLHNNAAMAAAQQRLVITGNTLDVTAAITLPAGWQCGKRKIGGSRLWTMTCTAASLASNATANFVLQVDAQPTPAGNTITVNGVASSNLAGDEPSNNSATFNTQVQ